MLKRKHEDSYTLGNGKRTCLMQYEEQCSDGSNLNNAVNSTTTVKWTSQSAQRNNLSRRLFEGMRSYFRQDADQSAGVSFSCSNCSRSSNWEARCTFCDKKNCSECSLLCRRCEQTFCPMCAIRDYNQREVTAICLTCAK
ncbi:hypothetical protein HDE_08775 [Halotydeus destructor]|nr:hypothetical protein HDE_08775 [Halotydeus destructor]